MYGYELISCIDTTERLYSSEGDGDLRLWDLDNGLNGERYGCKPRASVHAGKLTIRTVLYPVCAPCCVISSRSASHLVCARSALAETGLGKVSWRMFVHALPLASGMRVSCVCTRSLVLACVQKWRSERQCRRYRLDCCQPLLKAAWAESTSHKLPIPYQLEFFDQCYLKKALLARLM
jgi:hypothetical protein